MKIPHHIFKAYDIRGLTGTEVTPVLAQAVGRGFIALLRREKPKKRLKICIGRDMRETSVPYMKAVVKGLTQSGADVVDIGLVSTPAFYFGVGHTQADGGIMVSASHNPAAYNGFKLTRERAVPVSGETGIRELADIIEKEDFVSSEQTGSVEKVKNVPELSAKHEIAFAGEDEIGSPKVAADSANGMGAQFLDELFRAKGIDATRMYWELDGTFPNHEADPLKEENLADLQKKVKEEEADIGISTDGDGDRIFFVDNEGEAIPPAVVRGILSRAMLRRHPGATICYDVRPGKITEDMIREAGGIPVKTRVGHSLIKEKMREVGAVYGGESSGHFFYAFDNGVYEGPVAAAVMLMQEWKRSGKTLAEFVRPLKERYAHSGEINFKVDDKRGVMQKIKSEYGSGELNELDGITIEFEDFWFNVRPSNTEPKLRLNLEARDKAAMEKRRDEIIELIRSLGGERA